MSGSILVASETVGPYLSLLSISFNSLDSFTFSWTSDDDGVVVFVSLNTLNNLLCNGLYLIIFI